MLLHRGQGAPRDGIGHSNGLESIDSRWVETFNPVKNWHGGSGEAAQQNQFFDRKSSQRNTIHDEPSEMASRELLRGKVVDRNRILKQRIVPGHDGNSRFRHKIPLPVSTRVVTDG